MKLSLAKRIGNAARKARVSLGMTQEDAAEKIGVTVEFYARIERGTALPGLKTFVSMAVVLKVSADEMIGLTANATAQRILEEFSAPEPEDPPELRRLLRRLRQASEEVVRYIHHTLKELEKLLTGRSPGSVPDVPGDDELEATEGVLMEEPGEGVLLEEPEEAELEEEAESEEEAERADPDDPS